MSIAGTVGRNVVRWAMTGMVVIAVAATTDARAQVACGETLAPGSTTTLTADVGPCDGVESAIVVDSATLDLGGRTVSCADTDGDGDRPDGITLVGKKAAVRNGTIVGCDYNVVLFGSGKHVVENLAVTGAVEDGVWVDSDAAKSRFVGNTVSGNGDDGLEIRSAKNTISGNVVLMNGEDGIDIVETKANRVVGNTSSGNFDEGIDINGIGNKVSGNTVQDNFGYGIAVVGKRNKITGNTASGSGTGQDIAGADCGANRWKKNTFASPSACVH